jgi:transposase
MGKAPLGAEKTGPNLTDRAKKGTKRSLLTDGRSAPVGLVVSGANTPDFKLAHSTVQSVPVQRAEPSPEHPQHLCAGKGYDYEPVYQLGEEFGFTLHVPRRGEEHKPIEPHSGKKARRWVVERTHSWLNRFRRLLVRWEKRQDTYLATLHFALGIITWFHSFLPK